MGGFAARKALQVVRNVEKVCVREREREREREWEDLLPEM
jgi:hypothetical protein